MSPRPSDTQTIYRVLYRGNGREDWWLHTSGSGTSVYTTKAAAKAAVTQFKKRNKYYGGGTMEYKIQTSTAEWTDEVELQKA